ncbi:MAG: hypothetical protein H7843_12310, partial [Nitrospirota bacterium]
NDAGINSYYAHTLLKNLDVRFLAILYLGQYEQIFDTRYKRLKTRFNHISVLEPDSSFRWDDRCNAIF